MPKSFFSRLHVKELLPDNPPYEINETYHRFDQRNNLTVGRPSWDEEFKPLLRKSVEVRVKKKEIIFADVDKPQETGEQMIIPEKMRWVIMMGIPMDVAMMDYTPSPAT